MEYPEGRRVRRLYVTASGRVHETFGMKWRRDDVLYVRQTRGTAVFRKVGGWGTLRDRNALEVYVEDPTKGYRRLRGFWPYGGRELT